MTVTVMSNNAMQRNVPKSSTKQIQKKITISYRVNNHGDHQAAFLDEILINCIS